MPELLFIGFIGFLACWLLNFIGVYLIRYSYLQPSYLSVQQNLKLIGKYWSDESGEIRELSQTQVIERDQQAVLRSFFRFGVWAAFASWVGFVFMALMLFSMRVLARPRLEIQLMSSELATRPLAPDQVERLLKELN